MTCEQTAAVLRSGRVLLITLIRTTKRAIGPCQVGTQVSRSLLAPIGVTDQPSMDMDSLIILLSNAGITTVP
jgi:hypothetical protein